MSIKPRLWSLGDNSFHLIPHYLRLLLAFLLERSQLVGTVFTYSM
ncbi:hypothetical protein [Chroococcidiopsis sp. TS-821]|nr:hypothetical protein [Chroococcidiopsis sp. TS-821]